jgi:hypothetical protein
MSKSNRLSVVLLSAAVVFLMVDPPAAFGQRFRGGGESNQGNKEKKKDKDKDDERRKNDNNSQGNNKQGSDNQNNQSNQGNNQSNKDSDNQSNQGNTRRNFGRNATKSGEANKSGNPNGPSQFQPLIQGGKNQNDKDQKDSKGQNIQGQGGRFFNPGGQGFPSNSPKQQVIIGPGGAGNAEPANRKLGRWQGGRWEGTRKADNWAKVFGNNHQLFSSQWYKDHPQAWKYNNNKANVWVVATVPGVYSWLGWGSVPQQYRVEFGRVEQQFDHSHYGDWYPLGVYSLMSGEDDLGSRIIQLAVDRHGHIAGNYFDMIANSDHGISGDISRQSQRAEFWLNRNPNVRFRTSIFQLLQQPYGSITVRLPGGEQRWQFVRLENEP